MHSLTENLTQPSEAPANKYNQFKKKRKRKNNENNFSRSCITSVRCRLQVHFANIEMVGREIGGR